MADSLSKWTNDYIKAQQKANAGMLSPSKSVKNDAITRAILSTRANAHTDFGLTPSTPPEDSGFSLGKIGSNIIEALQRPLNAISNVALEGVKSLQGDPTTNNNPALAAWEGLSGQKHTTGADIIEQALPKGWGDNGNPTSKLIAEAAGGAIGTTGIPLAGSIVSSGSSARNFAKGTGGLAWDLAADPINLIPGAGVALKGAIKGAKAATVATKAAETVAKVADLPVETAAKIVEANKPVFTGTASNRAAIAEKFPDVKTASEPLTPTAKADHVIVEGKAGKKAIFPPIKDGQSVKEYWDELAAKGGVNIPPAGEIKLNYPGASEKLTDKLKTGGYEFPNYADNPALMDGVANAYKGSRLAKDAKAIVDKKIAESNQKVVDAAHVANAAAPETVAPLAVPNIPRPTSMPKVLNTYAQGKAGERVIKQAAQEAAAMPPTGYQAAIDHLTSLSDLETVTHVSLAKSLGISVDEAKPIMKQLIKDKAVIRPAGRVSDKASAGGSMRKPSSVYSGKAYVDKAGLADVISKSPAERSGSIRDTALPTWKAVAEAEFAKGTRPAVQASDGTSYALSVPHVLEALPPEGVNRMSFGAYPGKSNMYFSQVAKGMAETLRLDDLHIPVAERSARVAEAMTKAVGPRAKPIPAAQINEAADFLVGQTPAIRNSQYETAKTFVHKDLADAAALAEAKSGQIMEALQSPTASTSEAIHAISTVGSDIQASAKALGASDNAASIAAQETATLTAKVVNEADSEAARVAMGIKNIRSKFGDTPYAQAKINTKQARWVSAVEKQSEALAKDMGIDTADLATKADVHINGLVSSILHWVRTKFSFGYGTGDLANAFSRGEQLADTNIVFYHRAMNKVSKEVGRDTFDAAFSSYKQGITAADPAIKEAADKIHLLVNHIFDTKEPLLGAFWRSGAGIEQINKELRGVGFSHQFKVPKGKTDLTEVADQWRTWDIADPMDFLDKANTALSRMAAKQAFGIAYSRQWGSKTFKPGYVKLTDETDKSFFGSFVDKNQYYPKEQADYLRNLDDIVRQPTSFHGEKGAIAAVVNNVVDPAMQIWKPSVTILRPGFVPRNMFGDMMFSYFDGVKRVSSYRKAKGMMSAGGHVRREGITGLEKLNGEELKNGSSFMTKVQLKGGKTADLTYDSGYQYAHKNGIMQSHLSHEDLETTGNKITNGIMNSLPMRSLALVSEKEGQYTTLAHWTDLMGRKSFTRQFSTIEEAAAAAATRARKYHPTVQGLAPFERKWMRRIIPFYSWTKQAIPMVMTTLLSHPGRVMALPKATYNAMIAVGMDPNSISDQFPEDKVYPSFITNSITGPFGSYAFNLGSPQEGVLGDILNSGNSQSSGVIGAAQSTPLGNIAGMLSPFIKAPIELATDKRIDTGSNIPPVGEYIDSQIPFVNQLTSISGYTATGTLGSILTGAPKLDPQRAVLRGEKENFFNTNLANFLTGLSLNNVDKPSYKKIAALEGQG